MNTIDLIAAGLPVGFLIGLVGIGGVLLAPAMANLFGRDIHDAVALSLASFVLAGLVAAANARRAGEALGLPEWWLLGALVPGAFIGTLVTPYIPGAALAIVISLCIVLAGISCLGGTKAETARMAPGPAVLAGLGLVAGILSVISGTGGPLILVPMLLGLGMEVRRVLTVSQAAQLPVAATATLANAVSGNLNFAAAGLLGLAVVAGMLAGLWVAQRMDAASLRRIVAWCLVIAGTGLLGLDLWRMV